MSGSANKDNARAEEFKRAQWKESQFKAEAKSHPVKLALALRLRKETTLTIRQIAERLHMGSWNSLNNKLYLAGKASKTRTNTSAVRGAAPRSYFPPPWLPWRVASWITRPTF